MILVAFLGWLSIFGHAEESRVPVEAKWAKLAVSVPGCCGSPVNVVSCQGGMREGYFNVVVHGYILLSISKPSAGLYTSCRAAIEQAKLEGSNTIYINLMTGEMEPEGGFFVKKPAREP